MPAGVAAYVPLANITLGANAASVTFSSISQSYRDLVLVGQVAAASASFSGIYFNGDTGNNYHQLFMVGTGSSFGTQTQYGQPVIFLGQDSTLNTTPWIFQLNLIDYSITGRSQQGIYKTGTYNDRTTLSTTRWENTSAITSITLAGRTDNFLAGSSFALYGVTS